MNEYDKTKTDSQTQKTNELGERRGKRQDKNRGKVLASAAHILKKRIGVKRHKLLGIK